MDSGKLAGPSRQFGDGWRMGDDGSRDARILSAALDLSLRYGYRRVTMDDIASEAGMSRPALYQFFANKKAIYRAIVERLGSRSVEQIEATLAGDGPLETRLTQALSQGVLAMIEWLEGTTHGEELLDLSGDLAQDIIAGFVVRKAEILAAAYAQEALAAGIDPAVPAWQVVDWMEGMKQRVPGRAAREAALADFVALQVAGLRTLAMQASS